MKKGWILSRFFAATCVLVLLQTTVAAATDKALAALIPDGWKIISQASGDLNGDTRVDQVLILERTSPVDKKRDGRSVVKAFPRSVVIAFATPDGGFTAALRNDHVIPAGFENDSMQGEYTWEDLAVSPKGIITFGFQVEFPAGRASLSYLFRYQKGAFALIGAETENIQRGPGEFFSSSYNFLTQKVKHEKGGIFNDPHVKTSTKWGKVTLKVPVSLATIKNPNDEDLDRLLIETDRKRP